MIDAIEIRPGDVQRAAQVLLDAESSVAARGPLTAQWPDLDLRTAYTVQYEGLRQRLNRGETLIGLKLGLTSRAKQIRMGIDSPSLAWLTDAMALPAGNPLPREKLIHPRAEPEIVFVMGERLAGPGVTAATAMRAVAAVHGGIEIIDSRYQDFTFTLADAVADNSSAARFVLGPIGQPAGGWTSSTRHACWRSTGRSWIAPRAPPCKGTRRKRSRWQPTLLPTGAWPSKRAGSS